MVSMLTVLAYSAQPRPGRAHYNSSEQKNGPNDADRLPSVQTETSKGGKLMREKRELQQEL